MDLDFFWIRFSVFPSNMFCWDMIISDNLKIFRFGLIWCGSPSKSYSKSLFLHFLKRNDNNNTTFAIYSPDGNYFTVAIPQRDVGGLTRLCPDFTDRSVWCLSAVWILSGFSGRCLSVRIPFVSILSAVRILSGF